MYIKNLNRNELEFMKKLDNSKYNEKINFIEYVLDELDNNQINDLNETNPDLLDDSIDIKIFNLTNIGYDSTLIFKIKELMNFKIKFYLFYPKKYNGLISLFEKLYFTEKIKIVAEVILFLENYDLLPDYINGYLLVRNILNHK